MTDQKSPKGKSKKAIAASQITEELINKQISEDITSTEIADEVVIAKDGEDTIEFKGGVHSQEDQVQPRQIEDTMRKNFLNYAMSVIVSRALPDVRDGLKPVHRRILYALHKTGVTPGAKHVKSAAIVGEVIKSYHPHGDVAVYEAMARFAQDFSMRYTLINGQGNFGSIDGDRPAAMRYTEARMDVAAPFLLADIEKDTVDFNDNYDGTTKEPSVLPSQIPNILINGTTGIAVGMATEIPPHNLGEVVAATLALQANPDLTIEDLAEYIKGPDLPLGGTIYGKEDILNAYRTGRGRAVVRSKVTLEEDRIIVHEIPYQVNKADMLEKIAQQVRDKRIEGLKEIRDESNKDGIRIVFETKRDASPEVVLNLLYKYSELQSAVYFNLLALVNRGRQPKLLNLKEILVEFLNHREEVVIRRTQHDKKKAEDELHILEGLKIALDFIDRVIELIRGSYDKEEAATKLSAEFSLSDRQVEAILQMRLQTLTGLDKTKIEDERMVKINLIAELTKILENKDIRNELIAAELNNAASKIQSPRRSVIIDAKLGEYNKENVIEDETVLLQFTSAQYIKYVPLTDFSRQGRGGRGKISFNPKDEDFITQAMVCSSHDYIYAFTTLGRVFRTRVFDLPQGSRQGRGQNIVNYLQLQDGERIARILAISKEQEESKVGDLIFATKNGVVKRTSLALYNNVRTSGIIAVGLKKDDILKDVALSLNDNDNVILSGTTGKTVIFEKTQISSMGRTASGVRGIKLKKGSELISLQINDFRVEDGEVSDTDSEDNTVKEKKYPTMLVISERGYAKQTFLGDYRRTNRAASGVKTLKITKKTGSPVLISICDGTEEDLIVTTKKGITIRIDPNLISHLSRATQGVRIIKLEKDDVVVSGSIQ
jgi:DNA gyrase subunit A